MPTVFFSVAIALSLAHLRPRRRLGRTYRLDGRWNLRRNQLSWLALAERMGCHFFAPSFVLVANDAAKGECPRRRGLRVPDNDRVMQANDLVGRWPKSVRRNRWPERRYLVINGPVRPGEDVDADKPDAESFG